jgi:hypothetical protein
VGYPVLLQQGVAGKDCFLVICFRESFAWCVRYVVYECLEVADVFFAADGNVLNTKAGWE